MAFGPYAFRVTSFQACTVVASLLIGFLFVFGLGVYVGKEIQSHKTARHSRAVRLPVTAATPGNDASRTLMPAVRPPRAEKSASRAASGARVALPAPGDEASGGWNIQVLATRSERTAREAAATLRRQGYTPSIRRAVTNGEVLYRLRVGRFDRQEAQRVAARLKRHDRFDQAFLVSE